MARFSTAALARQQNNFIFLCFEKKKSNLITSRHFSGGVFCLERKRSRNKKCWPPFIFGSIDFIYFSISWIYTTNYSSHPNRMPAIIRIRNEWKSYIIRVQTQNHKKNMHIGLTDPTEETLIRLFIFLFLVFFFCFRCCTLCFSFCAWP